MQNFINPYNQITPQQQRLMQLEQQQFMQQQQQPKGFTIIPVTNEQEAYAAQIDIMNGLPSFFWNQGTKEIYLKKINQYGKADFIKFVQQNEPVLNEKEDVNINPYEKDFKSLNDKIDGLEKIMKSLLTKNEESVNKGGKNAK